MAKAKTRIFKPTDTSIIGMMENTIRRNWQRPCVTNYGTEESYTYGDVAKMIARCAPVRKKSYKMKKLEELTPELQALIGFAKPVSDADDDINGDKARTEYLNEKYSL